MQLAWPNGTPETHASNSARTRPNPFLDFFRPFTENVAEYGLYNALAQLAGKLTAPGVPDFYQGTDVWDFSLVDPDNRRPVDYAARAQHLAALKKAVQAAGADRRGVMKDLLATKLDGRIKLYVTSTLLRYRRDHPALFLDGANPVFSAPPAWKVADALGQVPFIVSFGSFVDETSAFADLILPDHSFLESWTDAMPESGALAAVGAAGDERDRRVLAATGAAHSLSGFRAADGDAGAPALQWRHDGAQHERRGHAQVGGVSGEQGDHGRGR